MATVWTIHRSVGRNLTLPTVLQVRARASHFSHVDFLPIWLQKSNPAVTIARSLSDTFAGIAPSGVIAFIGAQFAGMLAAVMLGRWLWRA